MKSSFVLLPLTFGFLGYVSLASPTHTAVEINFGRDVRPILSQHCFKCHGPDASKAAAGLRLDSFIGATARLSDGSAIVPGKPQASLLLDRVSETDPQMRMPPPDSGVPPLDREQIQTLRTWIAGGARYEKHWSFVAPKMPPMPTVSNRGWIKNPIDLFVLAKLDEAGMKPEPEADRDTLALRASQTLIGLPPEPNELARFRADRKPGAYERFVDRLMEKPEYGEHQARYWLDAVRYGDTHGLQLDNERSIYPYRDWVVRAFNSDLPFNKFVQWQVAGDLLPRPKTEQLIATGFVRMNLTTNEGGAIAEEFLARNTFDRVDTTSTVLLGLTVGCAKCHDHKYDPIRQKDYYGLYAYFDSTKDDPLDGNIALPPPVLRAASPADESRLAAFDARLNRMSLAVDPAEAASWFQTHIEPAPTTREWQVSPVHPSSTFDEAFEHPESEELNQASTQGWKPLAFVLGKDSVSLVGRDNASVYVRGILHYDRAASTILHVQSDDGVKVWLNGVQIHSNKVSRGLGQGTDLVKADFRQGDNTLLVKLVNGAGPDGLNVSIGDPLAEQAQPALAAYLKAPNNRNVRAGLCAAYLRFGPPSATAMSFRRLEKQKDETIAAIPMTLIAQEMAQPRPTYILKRGLYDQKGDRVDRHIPPVLGQLPAGSTNNRLGLAEWLTEPSNPLVARVFVNRIWQQHFGVGIVKTVEDFGSQGEWPLNQPLLDYLAVSFVQHGWSIKQLNRMIVTSAAFRQSSRITAAKLAKDPENRLISRGPRFRLDAEVIRDKALDVGGLLVEKIGGHGIKPYQPDGLWESSSDPASGTHVYVRDHGSDIYRRSLYLFWKRTSPPPVMVTFDAPLRDTCIVRRSTTNTPLQALALLNEPAFLEASRTMADRVLQTPGGDANRLRTAYDLAFARPPGQSESKVLLRALSRYRREYGQEPKLAQSLLSVGDSSQDTKRSPVEQASWMIVCSTLMNTNEFMTQH